MIDNSMVTVEWQQITDKIDQLNRLKNKPDSVSEMISVANGLHSLLLRYSVESNSASNISSSKRVAVVMPSVYTNNVKVTTIQNQDQAVVEEEIKEYGQPVDSEIASQKENVIEEVSLKEATVEEPVLESISKIKEMEDPIEVPVGLPIEQNEETAEIENKEIEPESISVQQEIKEEPVVVSEKAEEKEQKEEIVEQKPITTESKDEKKPNKQYSIWEAYSSNEVPTLAQQQIAQPKEISVTSEPKDTSYNSTTASQPIKDLKKAISISDRYLFINELFRGEESEYERSIKTINNFNVYQEARYWIDRELKVKLGWDDKSSAVRQFNNLVQRRFA